MIGISANFSAAVVSSDLRLAFDGSRSARERTVIVRLFQPMFTISVAEDEIPRNRDFFHPELGFEEGGLACSQLSSEAPPSLLTSVTYGRVTYFTVTSRELRSSEVLASRLRAAFSGIIASGEVTTSIRQEYSRIMSTANVRFVTFGGSQDDAYAALRSGDFRDFFRASRSIQAVPISMRFNYLSAGRPPLTIRTATRFSSTCCTPTNCSAPPISEHLHWQGTLDTGWHFGGTKSTRWGARGGTCGPGRTRSRVESTLLGGTPWSGRKGCWSEWVTNNPNDCRANLYYSRSGTSFIKCRWRIYEKQAEPEMHPEPLCRPSGGSC